MNETDLFRVLHRSIGNYSYGQENVTSRSGGRFPNIGSHKSFFDEEQDDDTETNQSNETSLLGFDRATVLCLYRHCKKLVGLVLDMEALSLQIIECIKLEESEEDDLMHTLMIQTMPQILICNTQVDRMLDNLKIKSKTGDKVFDFSQLKIEVQPLKNFRQNDGANFIQVLVEKMKSPSDHSSVLKDIISAKEFDSYSCCITPLIPYIENMASKSNGSEYDIIKDVTYFTLKSIMVLDEACFESLRIFNSPNQAKKTSSENSVYKLLDKTHTKVGSKTLKKYLLRPLLKLEDIKERHDSIEIILDLLDGPWSLVIEELVDSLKYMPNIIATIRRMSLGCNKFTTWMSVRNFLLQAKKINNAISSCPRLADCFAFKDLITEFTNDELSTAFSLLENKLDFTSDSNKCSIKEGVSHVLDQHLQTYSILESILEGTTQNIIAELDNNELALAVSTMYIQQLGYLIAIDFSNLSQVSIEGNVYFQEMQEVFRSSTCIYYKNKSMVEMDNQFGDIYSIIRDLEIEIYHSLSQEILNFESNFFFYYKKIGVIDAILSLSFAAKENDFCKPNMIAESCLILKESKHPLYDNGIPNDIQIGNNGSNVMVVTGPNYSGKSSLLCQCGIVVYLAHIGSFVPAREAIIGLTDRIITRVHSFESVGTTQSTFLIDSYQMMKCLTKSTSKSLILIDEFGKGTDVVDGPALLAAVIHHFSSLRDKSPKCIIATHFFELFLSNHIDFPYPIMFSFMKTHLNTSSSNSITYLYQLDDGLYQDSHGILCARNCGVPEEVLLRAQRIQRLSQNGENIIEPGSIMNLEDINLFNNAERVVNNFLSLDLEAAPAESIPIIRTSLKELE